MGSRLPTALAPMLEDPGHNSLFIVASLWELVIKQAQGRPDFSVQPAVLRRALLERAWLESDRSAPYPGVRHLAKPYIIPAYSRNSWPEGRWPSLRNSRATRGIK